LFNYKNGQIDLYQKKIVS